MSEEYYLGYDNGYSQGLEDGNEQGREEAIEEFAGRLISNMDGDENTVFTKGMLEIFVKRNAEILKEQKKANAQIEVDTKTHDAKVRTDAIEEFWKEMIALLINAPYGVIYPDDVERIAEKLKGDKNAD